MRCTSVLFCVLLSCASSPVEYTFLNAPPHRLSPRSWDRVEVFQGSQPPRSFVQIGTIEAPDSLENYSDTDLIRLARGEAGRRGCDALILTSIVSSSSVTTPFVGRSFITTNSTSAHGFHGACIVYRD